MTDKTNILLTRIIDKEKIDDENSESILKEINENNILKNEKSIQEKIKLSLKDKIHPTPAGDQTKKKIKKLFNKYKYPEKAKRKKQLKIFLSFIIVAILIIIFIL